MKEELNIGIIGTQFMGKAHSNAYRQVPRFFNIPINLHLHTACGRNKAALDQFAQKFGWDRAETDWEKIMEDETINIVDIAAPNDLHMPIAKAAAKAGKHILCEKPIALNLIEAKEMYQSAQKAGVIHMMVFNYRFVPAIALAKQLIEEGKIGKIHHFNGVYYQDWLVDPNFPITWRHDAKTSGSGAHGDMNAHIVDLARFLVGEFISVNGLQKTFVTERPLAPGEGKGAVTTDDATTFQAEFENGALGSFIATRFANGRKNFLRLEIFGSKGSLVFNLERMNELQYFSLEEDPKCQGFRTVLVTESRQPYIDAWWPPGHIIGWEHTFVHLVKTLVEGIAGNKQVRPDFYDGLKCQQVLDAVMESARERKWTDIELDLKL
ncbi:Gfo/Idh/MocA family protein [Negadavirga shengliensis]|uniref:Gfo/Idh/MocA family protein n=1 Tax=Negadavirga shengliensis TaxID=1389218 RepID=A0ABV9T3A9_9BACT